ncbi:MAG TPA: dihydrodipicolinate synthase family protein [Pirellulales bacterium]
MTPVATPFRMIAAPYTPFASGGDVNFSAVEELAELLVDNAVSGAFICGTTGESMSLTIDERMQLTEAWIRAAAGRFDVIVHVGHTCQRDAMELAAHAAHCKATSIAAMAPCFAKPATPEALADFCAPIAAAAGALPFYYYHIPIMTAVPMSMATFLPIAARRIPSLVGLKYSHEDFVDMAACVALENGRFEILFGKDELLLSALAFGVRGAVGSTYNFMAPLYQRVIAAFDAGDLVAARQEQLRAVALMRMMGRFGGFAFGAMKDLMRRLGIDCGLPRSPLAALTPALSVELDAELARMEFDSFCSKTAKAPARSAPPGAKPAPVS